MKFGYCETCLQHDTGPRHPESSDRLRAIRQALADKHGVEYVVPDPVERERVLAVHDDTYVDGFERFVERGGGDWDADTVASEKTWDAALASAGIAEWAATATLEGNDGRETPFGLGRPPGHHAVADNAMGFCFFNNVAIAAQSVIDRGLAERVAILDWDVHHGNGTQEIFYDQGDVFFVSLHEDGIYPDSGAIEETGRGDGELTTMNLPMPPGATSNTYLAVLEGAVYPALSAFEPDLLLISAGFDAHERDNISRTRVSTEGFGRLTSGVRTLADELDAGLAFTLEGGYALDTLSDCVRMVHKVFDGYEPTAEDRTIEPHAEQLLDEVRAQGYPGL